jgi:mannose-6-phosphate isomerase-like protein (cupin superfamily)
MTRSNDEINGGTIMKRSLCLLIVLFAGMWWMNQPKNLRVLAASPSAEKNAFTPDTVQYGPAPSFVAPGAQLAVLEGNPMAASGDYTVRLKMPDGYRINPHWHPKRENVTVLSGTLKVGMGDHFVESGMMSFPAGSFAYLDPDMHHYVTASGEVVVQIHGMAPVQFNYIAPNDDPSRKK